LRGVGYGRVRTTIYHTCVQTAYIQWSRVRTELYGAVRQDNAYGLHVTARARRARTMCSAGPGARRGSRVRYAQQGGISKLPYEEDATKLRWSKHTTVRAKHR
jgi:hypothetical protein